MDRSTVRLLSVILAALLIAAGGPVAARAQEPDEAEIGARQPVLEATSVPAQGALTGPVDDTSYIVGPGDRFAIMVWGQAVVSQSSVVTPEGELVLPGVAAIPVAGLSLAEVKREVAGRLAEIYHNVEVSVSLTGLRTMVVNVLGQVVNPGEYVCTPLELAGELIKRAGGLTAEASSRNITIERRDGQRARVDLTRYWNTGDVGADPPVLDGDVIFVPYAVALVGVYGAVGSPGEYELTDEDTVASLIELAGGFTRGAVTDSVELRGYDAEGEFAGSVLLDLSRSSDRGRRLVDGDEVYVREVPSWRRVAHVTVEGEVERPGPYGIEEGVDRVSDVLRRAGGPTEKAWLPGGRLIRPRLVDDVDEEFERLKDVPTGDMTELEYAYFKSRYRDRRSVVSDFVAAVRGDESADALLMDGDIIEVPRRVDTVEVLGQVVDPGKVRFEPGETWRYYIGQAGGYSSGARKGRVRVIKGSTGQWMSARSAGALEPGDAVWIPERSETDWWRLVREAVAFVASVATTYVVIDQATK
jgi:protein involved in polysaccharide export with SLBB domain